MLPSTMLALRLRSFRYVLRLLQKHFQNFFGRGRLCVKVTLAENATSLEKTLCLMSSFDPLGDHPNTETFCDVKDSFNDPRPDITGSQAIDKALIDLDHIHRHADQMGK